MQDNKNLPMENSELNSKTNNLIKQQESQKVQTNQLEQYIRSSWMIEIAGILYRKEENYIQLISKLAELAEITNFNKNQIDLVHRASTKPTALIIILFNKKSDRINFYNQRKKRKKLRSEQFQIGTDNGNDNEEGSSNYIYMATTFNNSQQSVQKIKIILLEAIK